MCSVVQPQVIVKSIYSGVVVKNNVPGRIIREWNMTIIMIIAIVINRDPQISRLAKSQKIYKLKKTVRNMFLNQINVGFDSRNLGEFSKKIVNLC